EAVHEIFAPRHLVGIVNIAQQRAMEITVPDMTYGRRLTIEALRIGLGLGDTVRQPRDRPADIGRYYARAGTQCLHCPIAIVTRLPELAAVLGSRGPAELAAAAFLGDLAEIPRLLGNLSLAAVKFEQQQRRLRQRQFRICVAGADLRRIE